MKTEDKKWKGQDWIEVNKNGEYIVKRCVGRTNECKKIRTCVGQKVT